MAVARKGEWPLLHMRRPSQAATHEHLDEAIAGRFNTHEFSIKPALIQSDHVTTLESRLNAQKRYSAVSDAVSVVRSI